jgi:hypothetical protein
MVVLSSSPQNYFLSLRVRKRRRTSGEEVLRLIQIRLTTLRLAKISPARQAQIAASANRHSEFHKRSQLFIRVDNETLSVAAMCVCNADRSASLAHTDRARIAIFRSS